jgi:hypothetical protein
MSPPICACPPTHTHSLTLSLSLSLTHTDTHTLYKHPWPTNGPICVGRLSTYIYAYIHTHTHTHTYVYAYIHTHTHTRTHTHAHTHTHHKNIRGRRTPPPSALVHLSPRFREGVADMHEFATIVKLLSRTCQTKGIPRVDKSQTKP